MIALSMLNVNEDVNDDEEEEEIQGKHFIRNIYND